MSNEIKCNECEWRGSEDDLVRGHDANGYFDGCPTCGTDENLMDVYEKEALKPCPFCGGKAEVQDWAGAVMVSCECGAQGTTHLDNYVQKFSREGAEAEAVKSWNTRATEGVEGKSSPSALPHQQTAPKDDHLAPSTQPTIKSDNTQALYIALKRIAELEAQLKKTTKNVSKPDASNAGDTKWLDEMVDEAQRMGFYGDVPKEQNVREAFEAYMRREHQANAFMLTIMPNGRYRDVWMNEDWALWQAALATQTKPEKVAEQKGDCRCACGWTGSESDREPQKDFCEDCAESGKDCGECPINMVCPKCRGNTTTEPHPDHTAYNQAVRDAAKVCRERGVGGNVREDREAIRCAEAIEKLERQ